MKKINYKSFKDVYDAFHYYYINKERFLFYPLGKDFKSPAFDLPLLDNARELVLERSFGKNEDKEKIDYNADAYKIDEHRMDKFNPAIKNQINEYVRLLATNQLETKFIVELLSSIYEAENFKMSEDAKDNASDMERKKLLDYPLEVLNENPKLTYFKAGVLYSMMYREEMQLTLFRKASLLVHLLNDEDFQQTELNKPFLNKMYEETKKQNLER